MNIAASYMSSVVSTTMPIAAATQDEKGLAKSRWFAQEDRGDEERTLYRTNANEFDFRYMRATNLPFNQMIMFPKSVNESIELNPICGGL